LEDSPRTILAATAGMGYHFAASVRSDASLGACKIRIMEYLGGVKVGQVDSPALTLSPSWQRIEVNYTPLQTGSEIYFTVKDNPAGLGENFDVDDCSICPLAAPARAIANGSGAAPGDEEALAAGARITAFVAPNPVVGASFLKFSTSRPGPLRVAL